MESKVMMYRIDCYLDEMARSQWTRFITEDGRIDLDCNALLFEALEAIHWPESDIEQIVDTIECSAPVRHMFRELEGTIREIGEAVKEWDEAKADGLQGVLRYHGMAVGDFV